MENSPALELDKVLYSDRKIPVHVKRERRIVWNLFLHLLANGFWTVSQVNDGEERTKTNSSKAAMELIFNLDEVYVYFSSPNHVDTHAVYLVLGNDTDIISDWNYTPGDPDGFNAAMEKFDAEDFA